MYLTILPKNSVHQPELVRKPSDTLNTSRSVIARLSITRLGVFLGVAVVIALSFDPPATISERSIRPSAHNVYEHDLICELVKKGTFRSEDKYEIAFEC